MITTESTLLLLLIAGLLMTMALQLRSIIKLKKHTLTLHRLRATHDEVFVFLVDNIDSDSLSIDDKMEIRLTIDKIDKITSFYDKAKERFTFDALSSVLFSPNSSPYVALAPTEGNPALNKVRVSVTGALLYAFSQYVPFFKARVLLKLFSVLSHVVILTGMKQLLSRFDSIKKTKKALETYTRIEHTYNEYQTCQV